MRILITGISGFVGSHLASFLRAKGIQAAGTILKSTTPQGIASLLPRIELFECDLTSFENVQQVIHEIELDGVFHLAAQSSVRRSLEDPITTFSVNFGGTLNLLEALRAAQKTPKVVFISSAEVYGDVRQEDLPVNEEQPLRPLNPYGASKAAAELICYQYWRAFGIPVVIVRAFNQIGPRQASDFVISSWAKQIAEIESNKRPPLIDVGNIEVERDFLDVRDVLEAYWQLFLKGMPGEVYNICSGKPILLREVLQKMLSLSKKDIQYQVSPSLLRSVEIKRIWGNPGKFKSISGWEPKYSLEDTLSSILNWWRSRL